jgi:hypothetical protein
MRGISSLILLIAHLLHSDSTGLRPRPGFEIHRAPILAFEEIYPTANMFFSCQLLVLPLVSTRVIRYRPGTDTASASSDDGLLNAGIGSWMVTKATIRAPCLSSCW